MSTNENISYWLAAIHLPASAAKIHRWLKHFASIKVLFHAATNELQAAGLTLAEIALIQQADFSIHHSSLEWSTKPNCHLITFDDAIYPVLLRELNDAPLVLYVAGDVKQLNQPQIAMVGSRNPTAGGRETAEQFAYCLAEAGLTITSGLALGIDAASHRGALAAGKPTIAVMGTGLAQIYPTSHQKLADEIIHCGAVISEFPPDTLAHAKNFPRRNRIISGLSLGVVVIEAAIRSGSLITARFAAEQGREVFAIPGSIHNPLARGCHQLIQQGAKLVEKAADVIEELGAMQQTLAFVAPNEVAKTSLNLDQKHRDLLACVSYETTALDTIIVRSGLTASQVSSMLLSLELEGQVNFVPGGCVRVNPLSH